MNTFKDVAYKLIQETGEPLHSTELTRRALSRGLLKTDGKTPSATMNAQLVMDIKTKGALSRFVQAGPSTFAINPQQIAADEEVQKDRIIAELEQEEEKEVEGGYIGKAGEHAVLSELLFRGYDAALMAVDIGVDILATKNSETFHLQVKTRNISQRHDAFHFNVRIAAFERHQTGKTFYIFILREKRTLDYVILPLPEIEKAIKKELVHVVGKGKLYRVTITRRRGRVYLGKQENDVTYYLNRWEIIK